MIFYISDKKVLETSTGNFFIVKNNQLITPKKGVLIGTTRNLIIKLGKKDFTVQERNVSLGEIKMTDEAFITSTTRGIMPVVKIDNQKIGNGKVGDRTKCLMKLFQNYIKK